jgi:hypothetical protein
MKTHLAALYPNTLSRSSRRCASRALLQGLLLSSAAIAGPVLALDYGPFSLTGFAKVESVTGSNQCATCQRFPGEDKQRLWADELVPGRPYGTGTTTTTLFQPFLGVKFDLGAGFKLSGLLSQRLRDGKEDIPGFLYEKNIALSHEEYGSVRLGGMTTRTWALADYPYGTNINLAEVWGSSGAGYGILTEALRYTSRPFDVLSGDLVLEATVGRGNTAFKINKPRFLELYGQYRNGDLLIDSMYQDTRNGNPQAWSHGPFTSLTANAADDSKLGGSGQSIAMLMARYQYNSQLDFQGGIRRNRWSGAYAVITNSTPPAQWNNMFNVDWNGSLNGVSNPGYAATSVDLSAGARYRVGKWVGSTGIAHLGKANTRNPSERGQSNSANILTAGVLYEYGSGLSLHASAGLIRYARLGLSPLSMPGNASFTNVDSRVTRYGHWAGVGVTYVF